jgi:hypothetical protein
MNDKENIEQNSLQQGQVIRNTKKRRQTTKTTYIFPKRTKKNRNKKNVMKLKNSLDNSEQHSKENEDFVLLPASKDILQSNDPKSNNQNTNHAQIPIESLHTADENNDSEQINDNLEPGHKKSETEKKRFQKEKELHSKCRKLGITFEPPLDNETEEQTRKRCRRNSDKIRRKINNMNLAFENIPDPPPFTTDE